jgi:hypothetical protein
MRRWAVILLTVAIAAIHISFYSSGGSIFLLNGLGYLGLLGLLYLPLGLPANLRRLARPALIGYAALTIAVYVIFSLRFNDWSLWLGPITKVLEIALIGLLWSEGRGRTA